MRASLLRIYATIICLLILGCGTSKRNFSREYSKVWKETLRSEAWKNSLADGVGAMPPENNEVFYTESDFGVLEESNGSGGASGPAFSQKYHSLVTLAYFKIIAEAERSDIRLKLEYYRLQAAASNLKGAQSKMYEENLELIERRYLAHNEMLEGLRSWNILSEYRSGDLDFFKMDNREEVYKKYTEGVNEDRIIDFLVYKLADLYHSGD